MVENSIIIIICLLIIISYVFDISASKTRIPSVIILLILGFILNQLFVVLKIELPNLNPLLPVFGTIGLILIVLEGALELDLEKEKIGFIRKSFLLALLPFIANVIVIVSITYLFYSADIKVSILNAIPISIISSAIAIPSANALLKNQKELIVYESSFSDIIGVIIFNFFLLNDTINVGAFGKFIYQLILIIAISFVFTAILSFLMSRINHKVKFIPIITFVILVYIIAKSLHLPALILILVMGLFLVNFQKIDHHKWIQWLKPEILEIEVKKFTDITYELTFLIKTVFFILFGFLLQPKDIINIRTLLFALLICISIYSIRYLNLKFFKLDLIPFFYFAPRGLITILLFLSIPAKHKLPIFDSSLIVQIIIITTLILMFGSLLSKPK